MLFGNHGADPHGPSTRIKSIRLSQTDGLESLIVPADFNKAVKMSTEKEYVSSSMLQIAAAVFPIVGAAAIGSWATASSLTDWYPHLIKPAINPPDWLFGPAWTALYLLMAYAGWRILGISAASPRRHTAMAFFYGQLALNASWPCLFFGLHSPIAGLIDIVPQWLLILATIRHFRRLDVIAALCLVPLAFWVGFAAILNFEIWRLNG